MTQILNVPMLATEATKIIMRIYNSNRMVDIVITSGSRTIRLQSLEDLRNECIRLNGYLTI